LGTRGQATMIDRETIQGPLGVSLPSIGGLIIVGIWLFAPLHASLGSLGGGDFSARDTDSQSVAGESARSGDLSAEDMDALSVILTDEQIATLNKPETLAKVKEVANARSRVRDGKDAATLDRQPELWGVEAELDAYWERLFAHLRTLRFKQLEDMGAIPEILADKHVATLNKPETLAKMNEVANARSRVRDGKDAAARDRQPELWAHPLTILQQEDIASDLVARRSHTGLYAGIANRYAGAEDFDIDVEPELKTYWKRLFAHLRTFQAPAQSVAGEGARSGDLSAEDMGAMPEILTDEQIATLNKPETLAKVKEVSAARPRVTNVDVEAELEAYWKRLFAHLRTFQAPGGSP
jgi:hypothetical protein